MKWRNVFTCAAIAIVAATVVAVQPAVAAVTAPLVESFRSSSPELAAFLLGNGLQGVSLAGAGGILSYAQLTRASQPGNAREPEAIRHILYDIQTFTDNSSVEQTFFGASQSDRTLSNMPQGGSLPEGQFFVIREICFDVFAASGFVTTAAGGVTGAIDDLGLILVQSRPTFTLNYKSKEYGPNPMLACRGLGGITGGMSGTFTAEENLQWGTNGRPGDGFFVDELIILSPKNAFTVTTKWPAAVNVTGDYKVRCSLRGTLYRQIA